MTKSKIISALNKLNQPFIQRPLFCIAVLVLLIDIAYVNLQKKPPDTKSYEVQRNVWVCGKVSEVNYTSDFKPKSYIIKLLSSQKLTKKESTVFSVITKLQEVDDISPLYVPKGSIIVYANDDFAEISTNSIVILSGKPEEIKKATNPGEFDLKKYYANKGIVATIKYPRLHYQSKPDPSLTTILEKAKLSLAKSISYYCPLESGTINTLLLGTKFLLPERRQNLYRLVGLSHFLVISGLHIQAIGTAFCGLFKRMKLKCLYRNIICFILIFIYSLMVGFTPSVFRAFFMFSLQLLAEICKRTYDSLTSMSISIVICILTNPLNILDIGFIYSYSCVFAICIYMLFINRPITSFVSKVDIEHTFIRRIHRNIISVLTLSLTIYLFELPIILSNNYISNPLSILLNLLLSLFSLPAIISGFAAMIFALLNLSFPAGLCDFTFALVIRFMDSICGIFNSANAVKITGRPYTLNIFAYYFLLLLFLTFIMVRCRLFLNFVTVLSLIYILTSRVLIAPIFYMLDIGQGDCMVIQYAERKAILIDAGSTSKSNIADNIIIPFLTYNGIREVKDIYLSHIDSDHTNAITDLCAKASQNAIELGNIIVTPSFIDSQTADDFAKLTSYRNDIHICGISAGLSSNYSKLKLICLWPQKEKVTGDPNSDSMVLLADYNNFDILLCADIPAETESKILNYLYPATIKDLTPDRKIEVYKVAHHGSNGSSSQAFLRSVEPKYSFISVGINNTYGHPGKDTLARLHNVSTNIYRTDILGCLSINMMK